MNRIASVACVILVAGCQAPPAPPPTPASPVTVRLPAEPPAKAADPRADAAAKLAEAQAQSIESLLAAKEAGAAAVPVIEPAKVPAPTPPKNSSPPARPPQPPGVAAVENAITAPPPKAPPPADGFRPVPAIGSTPTAVAIEPASPDSVVAPAPADPPVAAAHVAAADGPLDQQLSQKARDYPRDLAPQLDAQLLLLLKDEKVPSADAVAGLNVEDRDVLTSVLDGLTNFRNAIRKDNNLLITRKIRPLVEMADRLRSRADLTIANACLCRNIKGYGNYEPLAPLRLTAGVNSRPKLYYEIENVAPRLDSKNLWATTMRQDLVLYDGDGRPQWNVANVPVTDLCRNRRRDFFFAFILNFPTTLPPGNYTLKLTLSDAAAGRVSEASLPVPIVSAKNLPAAGPPLR